MKDKFKSVRRKQVIVLMIAIVCVIGILFQFSKRIDHFKEEVNIQSLQEISTQSGDIIESDLQKYLDFITKLSKKLEKEDIYAQSIMDTLTYFTQFSDFQRIGIADTSGHAHVTNGEELSIKGRDYFEEAMKGKASISDILNSRLIDEKIIALSAPIYNGEKIKGVIYGIIELKSISLLKNSAMDTEYRWLDIVDSDGDYIRKVTLDQDIEARTSQNVFDDLKFLDLDRSIDSMKKGFSNREEFIVEVADSDDEYYISFTPLKINQWYIVSAINQDFYEQTAGFGFNTDSRNAILLIMSVTIVAGIVIYYFYYKEKKYIKGLNDDLIYQEEIYRVATTKSDNIVFVYDIEEDDLQFINGHFDSLYQDELMNTSFKTYMRDLLNDKVVQEKLLELENTHGDYETEIKLNNNLRDEYYGVYMSYLADAQASHNRCVGVIRNITEEKMKEKQLKKRAQIDSLTKLYNRAAGEEKIRKLLQGNHSNALVLIDLDDFKKINDTLGHDYGDMVLKDVGRVLKQHFRVGDIICRLGGDEFVVLINDIPENVVLKIMNALISKIEAIESYGDLNIKINISAGVAMYPDMGTTFEELYKKADKALYKSKFGGKNQCYIYQNDEDAK